MVRTFQHRLIVSPGSFSSLFLHKVIKAESFYHDLIRFHDHNEPGWTRDGARCCRPELRGRLCSVQCAAGSVSRVRDNSSKNQTFTNSPPIGNN